MPKITEFMIGMILIGFIITVFSLFMAEMNTNYGMSYDNDSMEVYNQLGEIEVLTKEIEEKSDIDQQSGVLDVIGGYFTDAYRVMGLTKKSFKIFDAMSNKAVDDANLGQIGEYLRVAVSSIVLIMIVIGVVISALIKRDL